MDDLLPEKEIAARFGRRVDTLRKWRRLDRAPPYYRFNGGVFYRWPEVEAWLARRRR